MDIERIFGEEIPEVLKKRSSVDIAATKFELNYSSLMQSTPEAIQDGQFVTFDI